MARQKGVAVAARQLTLAESVLRKWVKQFPARPPRTVDSPGPVAHPAAPALAANPHPLGACSCGKPIADADAWKDHNQTIANPAAHRLTTTGNTSLTRTGT